MSKICLKRGFGWSRSYYSRETMRDSKGKVGLARGLLQRVVLNSASRREAKRGQSTNRKGEMSRASHNKQKIVKEI